MWIGYQIERNKKLCTKLDEKEIDSEKEIQIKDKIWFFFLERISGDYNCRQDRKWENGEKETPTDKKGLQERKGKKKKIQNIYF